MKKTHKLLLPEKEKILYLINDGYNQSVIARKFEVSRRTIQQIIKQDWLWIQECIYRRDRCICQICLRPGTKITNIGSTLPLKGSRVICNCCFDNIQKLIDLGYLKNS